MSSDREPARLRLAQLPTPLEPYNLPGDGPKVWIKRDDLTGTPLTGNKVRKLEYLLADARDRGARRVATCGGIQSNHCRATAIAAAQLGLGCQLFLRCDAPPPEDAPPTGNLALDRLVGAEVTFISHDQYRDRNRLMTAATGPDGYVIPEGGSNALGSWGYLRCVDELMAQWDQPPTAIVCATGSGGTHAGLAIGVRRRDLDVPVYGVAICDDSPTFQARVAQISAKASDRWPELPRLAAADVKVIEGYKGGGYAVSHPDELADIASVARDTGLLFDPVYTGKALRALLHEPDRFGERPLFLHTGGIFGLLA